MMLFSVLAVAFVASCARSPVRRSVSSAHLTRQEPVDQGRGLQKQTDGHPGAAADVIEALGIRVALNIRPLPEDPTRHTVRAGDDIKVRFSITDASTGAPVSGSRPGAWINPRGDDGETETCQDKIETLVEGSLIARAEYDLNEFYVLVLNDEASISVVDPLFGYGGSKLLAMIGLGAPGEDWVLSKDGNQLYVTMPLVNQVAVINTSTWKVTKNIDVGMRPTRIGMQPDGKYLWVSCQSLDKGSLVGVVSVIDRDELKVAATLPVGQGHHDFAFSTDSSWAYVSDAKSGTVAVVDVGQLKPVAHVPVGAQAGQVVFSPVSQCAYVVDSDGGTVAVIDGATHELIRRVVAAPGLGTIRVAPGGRYLLVANEKQATVEVIDVASDTVIQTADVSPEPDQIIFTLNMAYVRSRGSELILMIPLEQIGAGGPLSVVDFSGGYATFGLAASPSLADGMAAAPSGLAAIVANPVDRSIYYYREGMAAPMGTFQSYGREPRAVLVVDRSLQERRPGVYSTAVHLDHAGVYDVAFLLDVPRILHCFKLVVGGDPADTAVAVSPAVDIELLDLRGPIVAGEPVRLRYAVCDARTGEPIEQLDDLGVLAFSPRNWQQRQWAQSVGQGVYEVSLVLPKPGVYYVYCRVPSLKLNYRDLPSRVLTVKQGT